MDLLQVRIRFNKGGLYVVFSFAPANKAARPMDGYS
jgi:hypothetical protein